MADLTVTQGAISQSASISNFAAGSFATGAGDAIAVEQVCGFKPRYVKLIDETNSAVYEKTEGMASAKVLKSQAVKSGVFTSASTAADVTLTVGFAVKRIRLINETDGVVWEKTADMTAANSLKIVSHDTAQVSIDTNSLIVLNADGTVTVKAGLQGNSKKIAWVAEGDAGDAAVAGSLITFGDRGFTIASGAVAASSSFSWIAIG